MSVDPSEDGQPFIQRALCDLLFLVHGAAIGSARLLRNNNGGNEELFAKISTSKIATCLFVAAGIRLSKCNELFYYLNGTEDSA